MTSKVGGPARPLHRIADEIAGDWRTPYFGAMPYISAMRRLGAIDDAYGADSARSVVAYFLTNAGQWRGPVARAVKAELRAMLATRADARALRTDDGYGR